MKREDSTQTRSTSGMLRIKTLFNLRLIRCPSGFGPPGPNPLADMDSPGPNPLADMDPPTKLSENIILNVLVKMDDTLRSSAH